MDKTSGKTSLLIDEYAEPQAGWKLIERNRRLMMKRLSSLAGDTELAFLNISEGRSLQKGNAKFRYEP